MGSFPETTIQDEETLRVYGRALEHPTRLFSYMIIEINTLLLISQKTCEPLYLRT